MKPTSLAGDVTVQAGEDKVTVRKVLCPAFPHDQVAESLRHGRRLLLLNGILILLARGALRGTESVELQEGVIGEEEDESLANGASGAEDT